MTLSGEHVPAGRAVMERECAPPWDGLTPPYSTIVADPPWHYDERVIEYGRERGAVSASLPYSTMSDDEIARLPVMELAGPGAHLYLWTTNQHLWVARDICLGWGFDPVQTLVWAKPPAGLGPGGVFSNTTEFVIYARRAVKAKREVVRAGALIREAREAAGLNRSDLHRAVRGGKPTGIVFRWEDDDCLPTSADWDRLCEVLPALREVERPYVPPPPPKDRSRVDSTWWTWPRGPHSAKPAAFLDLVEQVSPAPYVELFARAPRLGWDSWGKGYEIGGGLHEVHTLEHRAHTRSAPQRQGWSVVSATQLREAATAIAEAAPDVRGPVEHDTLAAALVAALSDLTVVHTGRTVSTGTYSFDYADLGDVVKTTRPVLARHGVVALTPLHDHGNGLACTVTLLHTSGDRLDFGPFPFPHGATAQATGSMVTYHRRYALVAALGMAAGDDDDGAAAAPRQAEPPQTVPAHVHALLTAIEGLSEAERESLRTWVAEQELPDRPSKMNAEQATRVCDYIANGLPKDAPAAVGGEATE